MHCNSPFLFLCDLQKLCDDTVRGCCAIEEIKFVVFNPGFCELLSVVLWLVKSNDSRDSHFLKDRQIVFGCKRPVAVRHVQRPGKRYKFWWQRPIKVAVFYLFIVLILLHVECFIVVPSKCYSILKPCQTVVYCAFVRASSHSRVAERHEFLMVWRKYFPCIDEALAQYDYHVTTH